MTSHEPGSGGNELATIYDVASRAAVSISTVSLTLNSPDRVATATRHRVLTAADELGYIPRSEAVSRARRTAGRIGVVAPFAAYPSFARRLNGILAALREDPTDVVVFDEESAATSANPLLSSLPLTHRLDGLVVMGLPLHDEVAKRLLRAGLPTVLVDAHDARFDSVTTDDTEGGRLGARHLMGLGARTYAFLGEDQKSHAYVSQVELRLKGFISELGAAEVKGSQVTVRFAMQDDAFEAACALLSQEVRPDAVFASSDLFAAALARAARHLQVDVPAELSIVGYDDGDLARALDLTTVRQPLEESGAAAAGMLRERLQAPPSAVRQVTLGLELVPRSSSSRRENM